MTTSSGEAKQALSFSYGFYGIGGVLGSMIVGIMGVDALKFSGVWTTAVGILYFGLIEFRKKDIEEEEEDSLEEKFGKKIKDLTKKIKKDKDKQHLEFR